MEHLSAHGFDPGPTERPLLVGAATGLVAALPAGGVMAAFGTFRVLADRLLRLPQLPTAGVLLAGFILAGIMYGALFRRAASDRDGGWLFGLAYGFLLWIVAPVVAVPLVRGAGLAAGIPGIGFLLAFLVWGLALGILFPFVHRPLRAGLDGQSRDRLQFGPDVAATGGLFRSRSETES